LLLYKIVLL